MISESGRETWQAIGRVNIGGFKSRSACTGTLIAPRQVLTAAHCVVDLKTGKPFPLYRVFFVAAYHMGDHRGVAKAQSIRLHPDYPSKPRGRSRTVAAADIAHDLAVITLDGPLAQVTPADVTHMMVETGPTAVLGYRRDRSEVLSDHLGCTAGATRGSLFQLSCPVIEGTSGAPVWQEVAEGGWEVVGVVSARTAGGGIAVSVTQSGLVAAGLLVSE